MGSGCVGEIQEHRAAFRHHCALANGRTNRLPTHWWARWPGRQRTGASPAKVEFVGAHIAASTGACGVNRANLSSAEFAQQSPVSQIRAITVAIHFFMPFMSLPSYVGFGRWSNALPTRTLTIMLKNRRKCLIFGQSRYPGESSRG